jgi:hypothetical protein
VLDQHRDRVPSSEPLAFHLIVYLSLRAYSEAATRWMYDDGGLSRADPSGATISGGSHVHGG